MKTIKPFRLSVVTRSYEVNRTFYLGVSTLAYFDLTTSHLLPEVPLWQFAAQELGKEAGIDAGIPKSKAEFLVTGSIFTPGGAPQETCPAIARIGTLEKTVYAIGDRFWKGRDQTKPLPFTSMPLVWERAFGGEGFRSNPLGKGYKAVETEHGPIQFLPNLELPGKLITKPNQAPEPAGFGPIDLTWPQRFSKAGTYDQAWLKEDFPGFARDIDWSMFNLAAADQQQSPPFVGNEAFELVNLHPTKPRLAGKLPRIRARTFIVQKEGSEESFLELSNRLTTVWFFPHAEKGILIFQGSLKTREDDAADVATLMIAAELLGEDRGVEHYRKVLEQRLDKDKGVFLALRDEDLVPPSLITVEVKDEIQKMAELVKRDGELEKRQHEKRARLIHEARATIASFGLDPDEHGPGLPPPVPEPPDDLSKLPEMIEQYIAEAKKIEEQGKQQLEDRLQEVAPVIAQHGMDPDFIRRELKEDFITGPPTYSAEAELDRIRKLDAQSRAQGVVLDELQKWLADTELHARWRQIEQQMRDAYLVSAHFQSPAPQLAERESQRVRDAVLAALHAGEAFEYRDLTGADLSGLDLRGANFRKGWLESTNLAGSNLEGADFSEAVLARADLSGASLARAKFTKANLGEARLIGVTSGGAIDLSNAVLRKADLTNADLHGAVLDNADLSHAIFSNTNLSSISAEELSFISSDLRGLTLVGARLKSAVAIDSNVSGVDLSDSELEALTLMQCVGAGIKLVRSKTRKLVVCQSLSFDGSDFTGAQLESANFRGTSLKQCNFSGALLDNADLSETDLAGSKFYRAVARGARFAKTNLYEADLTSANLLGADLQKADIRGARFLGANLYGANFGRVLSDSATVLTESNQTKVTIYPLRRS